MHEAEVRVHYAALQVSLVRAGMLDASQALWEWAEEWLEVSDDDRTEWEHELDIEDA